MNKIKSIIRKVFQPIRNPQEETKSKNEPQDAFQFVDKVEQQLANSLRQFYDGRRDELMGQTLFVWIEDDNKRSLISKCHDRLLTNLCNISGFPVSDVVFKRDSQPKGATVFYDGIAYTIGVSDNHATQKGLLRVHNDKGTLRKKKYTLLSEGGRYFIGRAENEANSIVVESNPNDPNYELNKYVRSHHAYIEYRDKLGFCLFVERDGTQVFGGSRTQIRRLQEDELVELNNPQQPVPLKDGDVIVLGKNVELEWIIDKSNYNKS